MKKALITGILGQDGSYLAELLLVKKYHVFGIIPKGGKIEAKEYPQKEALLNSCQILETDISDSIQVKELLRDIQPDEIYHLAACHHSSERGLGFDGGLNSQMRSVNFLSTHNFVDAIMEIKPQCRFLFAGSSQMYQPENGELITEETPMNPFTYYGCTKAWSRELIRYYWNRYGLWGCTAILFNHESPRRSAQFVTRKITQGVARIRNGLEKEIELRDISAKADWSSAEDFIRAMNLMLSADTPSDYVLASGQLHSIQDILVIAFSKLGMGWRAYTKVGDKISQAKHILGDPTRIKRELGWEPVKSFKILIEEMVDFDCALVKREKMRLRP